MYQSKDSRLTGTVGVFIMAAFLSIVGYILLAIRYGPPIRQANMAVQEVKRIDEKLLGLVDSAVTTALDERAGDDQDLKIDSLTVQLRTATEKVHNLESSLASLQAELLTLKNQRHFVSESIPVTQPTPETDTPSSSSSAITTNPQPTTSALISDTKGDVQIIIHKAWSNGETVTLEATITYIGAEDDGYFAIVNYAKHSDRKRIVTSGGIEIRRLEIAKPGAKPFHKMSSDLIPGIPMKHTIQFDKGEIPKAPFMASRIEFIAYADVGEDTPLLFQFDNILITEP